MRWITENLRCEIRGLRTVKGFNYSMPHCTCFGTGGPTVHHLALSVHNLTPFHSKLLWQYGDRHYQANRWDTAVDWFLGGTHQLFRSFNEGTMKCYRKAALCYIQQREYASAAAVVRLCPGNEAATHYIGLLTSVKQGIYPFITFSTPTRTVSSYALWFKTNLIRITLSHRAGR